MRIITLLLALATAAPARAQEESDAPAATETVEHPWVELGLGVGAYLPVDSPRKPFVMPRLEIGVNLPVLGGRLAPFVVGAWSRPDADGSGSDIRLPGDAYTWAARQHEGIVGGGLRARFLPLSSRFNGTVALAATAVFVDTTMDGEADGEVFGTWTEFDTQPGLLADAGFEAHVGPGAIYVEVMFTWSRLEGTLSGVHHTGAITPGAGYRFLF